MDTFVKKFQQDRYELWLAGKDIGAHPEEPSRLCAAPPPTDYDIICNKKYTFLFFIIFSYFMRYLQKYI